MASAPKILPAGRTLCFACFVKADSFLVFVDLPFSLFSWCERAIILAKTTKAMHVELLQ